MLISKLSSPVKLTRKTRAGIPATLPSRTVRKGKSRFSRAMSGASRDRTARAFGPATVTEIGSASCRERVCQYGELPVVAGQLKKKEDKSNEKTLKKVKN